MRARVRVTLAPSLPPPSYCSARVLSASGRWHMVRLNEGTPGEPSLERYGRVTWCELGLGLGLGLGLELGLGSGLGLGLG